MARPWWQWLLGWLGFAASHLTGCTVILADDAHQCESDAECQALGEGFEGTFCNARAGSMIEFMGTDATLYVDRGRFELTPEPNRRVQAEEMVVGTAATTLVESAASAASRVIRTWAAAAYERAAARAPPADEARP